MRIFDPGHHYELAVYDRSDDVTHEPVLLRFVKREDVGCYPGTSVQEVIRVLIDRERHLDELEECLEHKMVVANLKWCLWHIETRAARRSGLDLTDVAFDDIELRPTCATCGHIVCGGHTMCGGHT